MKHAGVGAFSWPENNEVDDGGVGCGVAAGNEYFIVAGSVIGIEPPLGIVPDVFVLLECPSSDGAEFHLRSVGGGGGERLERASGFGNEIEQFKSPLVGMMGSLAAGGAGRR